MEQSARSIDIPYAQSHEPLRGSILAAVVYGDLFDYPLTIDELTRYQVGSTASAQEIAALLSGDALLAGGLAEMRGYYSLSYRTELARIRVRRELYSRKLWRKALRYAGWLSWLPFVRMVAVTGALSVHNVGPVPDIDLLIVAARGRVWLCRRALILCVRLARALGDDLCPNYVIAEDNLRLDQQDFYTAHELAQMVPLYGLMVYQKMMRANSWASRYLPNAFTSLDLGDGPPRRRLAKAAMETVLGNPLFDAWECWELGRLREKLRPALGSAAEVVCSPSQCKGHTGLHRRTVMTGYKQRLQDLGLSASLPRVLRQDQLFQADDGSKV